MTKTATAKKITQLPGHMTKHAILEGLPPGLMMDNGDRSDPMDDLAQLTSGIRDGTAPKRRTKDYYENLAKAMYIGCLYSTELPRVVQDRNGNIVGIEGGGDLAFPSNVVSSSVIAGLAKQGRGRKLDATASKPASAQTGCGNMVVMRCEKPDEKSVPD